MLGKLLKPNSLHAQLEKEREEMEAQQAIENQQAAKAEVERAERDREEFNRVQRESLNADISLAEAAVLAFEKAATEAMRAEEVLYKLLYADKGVLNQKRPEPFNAEGLTSRRQLRQRVGDVLGKLKYQTTYNIF